MESDFSVYSLKYTGLDAGFCTKTICTSTQTNSGSTTLGTNLTSCSSGFSSRNSLWGYYEQSTVEQKQGIMCPVMVLYSMNIRCYQSWAVWQISWICLLIPNIRKKNISDNQRSIYQMWNFLILNTIGLCGFSELTQRHRKEWMMPHWFSSCWPPQGHQGTWCSPTICLFNKGL